MPELWAIAAALMGASGSGKPQPATRSYGCPPHWDNHPTEPFNHPTDHFNHSIEWLCIHPSGCIHPTKPFSHLTWLLSHPREPLKHSTEPFYHPVEPFNHPTDHFNHPTEHSSLFFGYLSTSSFVFPAT